MIIHSGRVCMGCTTGMIVHSGRVCMGCTTGMIVHSGRVCMGFTTGMIVHSGRVCMGCTTGMIVHSGRVCMGFTTGMIVNSGRVCMGCTTGMIVHSGRVCMGCSTVMKTLLGVMTKSHLNYYVRSCGLFGYQFHSPMSSVHLEPHSQSLTLCLTKLYSFVLLNCTILGVCVTSLTRIHTHIYTCGCDMLSTPPPPPCPGR